MTPTPTYIDVTGAEVPLEADWGVQAQREAEDHLTRVWSHFHGEEQGTEEGDSPAIGAFDGCQTCEVRETLFAAIPVIEAGLNRDDPPTYEKAPRPLRVNLVACPQEPVDQEAVEDALLEAWPAETGEHTHKDLVDAQVKNLIEKGLLRGNA